MLPPPQLPSLSIIIPTLNAAEVLEDCLRSIKSQSYPQNKIELLLIDGGSTDNTINIAKKFGCHILANPLKTAEAGKYVGVCHAKYDLIGLIDSDNILPNKKWILNMVTPLIQHPRAVGAEPWEYTYRRNAGYIERYSSLIGANDPYSLFIGNYDRQGPTHHWSSYKLSEKNKKNYIIVELNSVTKLPTIGANGTIYKTNFIKEFATKKYIFDVDILHHALKKHSPIIFIKCKTGIIHSYCENSLYKFIRKQIRRVKDFYTFRPNRDTSLHSFSLSNFYFVIYSFCLLPAFFYSLVGFLKKRDIAWFFHPLACLITASIYSYFTLLKFLHLIKPQLRETWSQ